MRTNHTVPTIDPALEVISKVSGTYPPTGSDVFEDSGEDGGEDGTDGSMRDDSSQSDGNEEAAHNHLHSVTQQSKFKPFISPLLIKGPRFSVP